MPEFTIRPAIPADAAAIVELIRGIATYEKLLHEVEATPENIKRWLFGPHPAAECLLAFVEEKPVGFALFFTNFSTFKGLPGIHLEDLFVYEEYRGLGIGKALFLQVVQLTNERGYGRMEWSVLNWNTPAIDFYHAHGAIPMDGWTIYRLTGDKLAAFIS